MSSRANFSQFNQFFPIAEAIARLLHPHAEVVIHDLATQKIVGIFNSFSIREVGDESLLEEEFDFATGSQVIGPYPRTNWDGRNLKSITSVLKDPKGKAIGLLCINLDISAVEQFQKVISSFLVSTVNDQPKALFKNDWRERINSFIDQHLRSHRKTLASLTKDEQCKLVQLLYKEGAFDGKNAAHYVGQVLGISRASVYNYLKSES